MVVNQRWDAAGIRVRAADPRHADGLSTRDFAPTPAMWDGQPRMDAAGDMAVGYTSQRDMHPAIRYADGGDPAVDPLRPWKGSEHRGRRGHRTGDPRWALFRMRIDPLTTVRSGMSGVPDRKQFQLEYPIASFSSPRADCRQPHGDCTGTPNPHTTPRPCSSGGLRCCSVACRISARTKAAAHRYADCHTHQRDKYADRSSDRHDTRTATHTPRRRYATRTNTPTSQPPTITNNRTITNTPTINTPTITNTPRSQYPDGDTYPDDLRHRTNTPRLQYPDVYSTNGTSRRLWSTVPASPRLLRRKCRGTIWMATPQQHDALPMPQSIRAN